jgi:hypothetical protein
MSDEPDEPDRIILLLAPDGQREECRLSFQSAGWPDCRISFESLTFGRREYVRGDYFDCLCDFRREIESIGWRVLCNGARRNAWPSGMARDMGQGLKLYLLRERPVRGSDLVETFGPADPSDVATVEQQKGFVADFFGDDQLRE